MILTKRKSFCKAFDDFDPKKITICRKRLKEFLQIEELFVIRERWNLINNAKRGSVVESKLKILLESLRGRPLVSY